MNGLKRYVGLAWALAGVFAVFVYCFGLDGLHIPRNGDEYPYAHITRLTAASGHLLPLQSSMEDMRNTKPPLLFWQGIVSTDWGQDWTLLKLRYPSVIYTLATAFLVFLLTQRLSGDRGKAWLGALAFLAFFSTYRFGRPFLTNPPEVFWLFLPFFLLLFCRNAFASKWLVPLLGLAAGVGLLYKSFALLLPTGIALAWWYAHQRNYQLRGWLRQDVWKLALIAVIALALFSLWFLLDPHPQEVWREFVLKENAGKFHHHHSYLGKLLHGPSSFWVLLFGYPFNGGLLAFPIFGLMISALRCRASLSNEEKMLWILLIVYMVVFTLPSQRSARYLLPAMPALAVLCALGWHRISRIWFVATMVLALVAVTLMAYLSWHLQQALPDAKLYSGFYWAALLTAGGVALFAMLRLELTLPLSPVVVLTVFFCSALFMGPFDGPLGTYGPQTQREVVGRVVAVPYNFNAKYEGYRFLLPGAEIQGYQEQTMPTMDELAKAHEIFAIKGPLSAVPCQGCELLGERIDIKSRQDKDEVVAILHGHVLENLFSKEMLIRSPHAQ